MTYFYFKPPCIILSCFHVIFPGFRLLMYTVGKLNENEIRWILDSCILFCDSHCIVSSIIYLATWRWPVQRPKHVVSLNKTTAQDSCVLIQKNPSLKATSYFLLRWITNYFAFYFPTDFLYQKHVQALSGNIYNQISSITSPWNVGLVVFLNSFQSI